MDTLRAIEKEANDLTKQNNAIRETINELNKGTWFQWVSFIIIGTVSLGFIFSRHYLRK